MGFLFGVCVGACGMWFYTRFGKSISIAKQKIEASIEKELEGR
jgi:hypothetical protein